MNIYLNVYLTKYEKVIPMNSDDSSGSFIGEFFVQGNLIRSYTSLKQKGSALKKLCQFLYEADEIFKIDLTEIIESIRVVTREGEEYLILNDDGLWF